MGKPVVILCGGFGSRMGNEINKLPKPMTEIAGKPILIHLLKFYSEYGHDEFIICLGYMKEIIIKYFNDHPEPDKTIHLVDTGDGNTTKSQRLLMIKHLIKDDQIFLSYGDDLSNVNLDALFEFHKMKNKIVTITTVNLKSDFGIININSNNLITKFIEKPLLKDIWINAGFAVLNRNIFNYLKFGELESTVYKLLARKREVCAFKHQGFWHGINTVKDQIYLNKLCFNGKQPWSNIYNE